MGLFRKEKPKGSSAFSEFIRTARASEKKRVYARVLQRATERQRAVMDDTRIDVNDPDELNSWAKSLGVSPRELQDAIRVAGPISGNVRQRLAKR